MCELNNKYSTISISLGTCTLHNTLGRYHGVMFNSTNLITWCLNRNSRRTGSYSEPDSDKHHDRDMTLTLATSKLFLARPVHREVMHLTVKLYHLSAFDKTRYTRYVLLFVYFNSLISKYTVIHRWNNESSTLLTLNEAMLTQQDLELRSWALIH